MGGKDGLRFTARTGDYVLKPRGISHGFWNVGSVTVRYIELSGRDGFEKFIDSRSEGVGHFVQNARDVLDMQIHTDRVPELMLEHRLTGLAGVNMEGLDLAKLAAQAGVDALRERFRGPKPPA